MVDRGGAENFNRNIEIVKIDEDTLNLGGGVSTENSLYTPLVALKTKCK